MDTDSGIKMPVRFWGLDPLFWSNVKLLISHVNRLKEMEIKGSFCLYSHPVTKVEIVGYIVGMKRSAKHMEYKVDDGTGVISCLDWSCNEDNQEDNNMHKLGQLVTVQGRIKTFKQQQQLTVTLIYVESDLNMEMLHWMELMKLHQEVYTKPFTPPPDLIGVMDRDLSTLTTEDLKMHLMEIILQNQLSVGCFQFTVDSLSKQSDVMKIVEALRASYSLQVSREDETRHILKQAVKGLRKNGLCYFKDEDTFQVISHEANLGYDVREVIRKESKDGQSEEGVLLKIILESLRKTLKYQYVRMKQVQISLEKLVQESFIYHKDDGSYGLM